MAVNPQLVLVSCRHCLRPVALARGAADVELPQLLEHLHECIPGEPVEEPRDGILRHFRIGGDRR